jgi:hypothetical protein
MLGVNTGMNSQRIPLPVIIAIDITINIATIIFICTRHLTFRRKKTVLLSALLPVHYYNWTMANDSISPVNCASLGGIAASCGAFYEADEYDSCQSIRD